MKQDYSNEQVQERIDLFWENAGKVIDKIAIGIIVVCFALVAIFFCTSCAPRPLATTYQQKHIVTGIKPTKKGIALLVTPVEDAKPLEHGTLKIGDTVKVLINKRY